VKRKFVVGDVGSYSRETTVRYVVMWVYTNGRVDQGLGGPWPQHTMWSYQAPMRYILLPTFSGLLPLAAAECEGED
jgi:hypothetical protein